MMKKAESWKTPQALHPTGHRTRRAAAYWVMETFWRHGVRGGETAGVRPPPGTVGTRARRRPNEERATRPIASVSKMSPRPRSICAG
jgi:hypothetical protein